MTTDFSYRCSMCFNYLKNGRINMPIEIWVAIIGGVAVVLGAIIGKIGKKSSNSRQTNIKQEINGDGNRQVVNIVVEGEAKDD